MCRIGCLLRGIAGLCGLRRDSRGTAAVELALVAPALFLFVFGIAETGRALWLQNALDYSVAEAARCASINPTICDSVSDVSVGEPGPVMIGRGSGTA